MDRTFRIRAVEIGKFKRKQIVTEKELVDAKVDIDRLLVLNSLEVIDVETPAPAPATKPAAK